MTRKIAFLAVIILVAITLILSACGGGKTDNNSPASTTPGVSTVPQRGTTGTITTGKAVESSPIPVTPQGGSFTLNQPDSPINGMVLGVPAGAYANNLEFKISYVPINKHTFGENFNPLTPLIKIDNGGAYADAIMEVTIPVTVPADSFAMGFIYDQKTKTLQGLPTLAQTQTSITVGTRHFTDFLISMIPLTKLKSDIDSGFRPGIDDWQFTNRGSYIAKGGHCAGQSVTALWYYVTQPDGKDLTLYNRYDNNGDKPATPALWQDDSLGYRFASTVHHDINWDSFENEFWTSLAGVNDDWTWKLFAYSMQITGEPQEVGIYSNAGGGHDMICYRVKDGNLYIADPNYPGNTERRIEFKDGKFVPYNSGANAEEIAKGNGKAYETIEYCAKTTTVSWDQIAQRWAEFKDGTIGDDSFPAVSIAYKAADGNFTQLTDGFISAEKLIAITTSSATPETGCYVFRDGVQLKWDANGNYELNPGINKLGIYIIAWVDAKDKNGNPIKVSKYIDFKYLNVIYGALTIDPPSLDGEPNTNYTFTAKIDAPPANAVYDWYFNGTPLQKGASKTLAKSFPAPGFYTISVKLLDSTGKEILEAQSNINIQTKKPSQLSQLQKFNRVNGHATGKYTYETWTAEKTSTEVYGYSFEIPWKNYPQDGPMPITWSGSTFSGKIEYNKDGNIFTAEVSGSVSEDGTLINSVTYKDTYKSGDPSTSHYALGYTHSLAFSNLKILLVDYGYAPARGTTTPTIVDEKIEYYDGAVSKTVKFKSLEWTSSATCELRLSYAP